MIPSLAFLLLASLMPAGPPQAVVEPYLRLNGAAVEPTAVSVARTPGRIRVTLTAPRDGSYSFGLSIEAGKVAALAPGRQPLSPPATLHYPYDWTWQGQGNVLSARPRLIMPGIEVGGVLYVVDTQELWSLRLEPAGEGRTRALLLKHRSFNDGGDAATTTLPLRAGQQEQLDVLTGESLEEIHRVRFGGCPSLRGKMAQIAFRGWPTRSLAQADYGRIAENFRGVFDYAIVREVEPHAWIPPLFHRHGIRVLHYQYLGALRRQSAQVTDAVEADIGLKDAKGQRYTAPTAPNGNWLLCDIRRDDVCARFVNQARAAVQAGYDGVFLDGYPFWADATGRRGGHAPQATCSLAYARWKLLRDARAAIRSVRPDAVLGALGNHYYDALGQADFVMKERMYSTWADFAAEFDQRRTTIRQDMDAAFETEEAPYVARNLCYGAKGYSPISVQSSLRFIRQPRELLYFDVGDFYPERLSDWLKAIVAIATQDDLFIQSVEPTSASITFEGLDVIRADARCVVKFSRAVSLASDGAAEPDQMATDLTMETGRRYRLRRP